MPSLSDTLLLNNERSLSRTLDLKVEHRGRGSLADIFRDPKEALFESRVSTLRELNGVIAFPHRQQRGTSFMVTVNDTFKLVNVFNQGFKKALRESEREVDSNSGVPISQQPKTLSQSAQSLKDISLARFITRGQPLTKSMYRRLEHLESAGYIKIDEITNKHDVVKALTGHAAKMNISMFDVNMVKSLEDENNRGRNKARLKKLINEGYLMRDGKQFHITDKFENTVDDLIQKGLLDDRSKETIKFTLEAKKKPTKQPTAPDRTTDSRNKKPRQAPPSPTREIKRQLTQDQMELITTLKQFGNMTESQLYGLYERDGREKYFGQDMAALQKKGLLEKERRQADGIEFNLYNLKYTGNKIGDYLHGHNAQSKSYSKKFTKSDRELIHDLLQYEATQCVKENIETDGGVVTDIVIDRNQRARLYNNTSIRETGGLEGKIIDVEVHYKDQEEKEQIQYVEIDRGYSADVIRNKSANFSQITWFTDISRQANCIARQAKSTDKVYLL